MSTVWTKARKNTPEIDCGLCGFTTCGAFARSIIVGKAEISTCPVLGLEQYNPQRDELVKLSGEVKNTEKPAPEQPEGGVLLSKPCMDSPDLLMAEMRIFNGVTPGEPMKYGVLDPAILCWLLDCVSSKYEDMRCSKDLAYAWGDMEEIKIHILRDGRVRMRRAKGAEHALDSFKIIERTVMGAIICNCCGRDLFTVLSGLVSPVEEHHTVLGAGSTVSIKQDLVDWTPQKQLIDTKPIAQMIDLVDTLYSDLKDHLDLAISGKYPADHTSDTRSKICKINSLMVDPLIQGDEVVFLKGLALAFFIDNAMIGLSSLNQLLSENQTNQHLVSELLSAAKTMSLRKYDTKSLGASEILILAHSTRVERAIQLYNHWKNE
ncbi:MAG: (Fe-S)-binding protein [Candidatus Thorarchaeota archaeon]